MASRILIAGDNELNQRIVREMLGSRGYVMEIVKYGDQVIPALEQNGFDLLILDVLTPGLDGIATAREIRSAEPARLDPDIPILAVTSMAAEGDRERCLEAGMNAYISSPFQARALFECVERLLHGAPAESRESTRQSRQGAERQDGSDKELADILRSMSGMLARDCEKWQSELRAGLENNDFETLRVLAHKVRGTADIVCSTNLSDTAEQLEGAAQAKDENRVEALVPAVISALRAWVEQVRAGG